MLLQIVLLPVYLWLMAGAEVVGAFDPHPFVEAFLLLIVLPLVLAAATQLLAKRFRAGRAIEGVVLAAMVPLMMLTLAVVIGSQVFGVSSALGQLLIAVPVFVVFVLIVAPLGALLGARHAWMFPAAGRPRSAGSPATRWSCSRSLSRCRHLSL
jgi:ACR3 family arsenite efflux pump ArsB